MLKFSFVDIFNFYLWGCIINILIVISLVLYHKSINKMCEGWKHIIVFIFTSYVGVFIFLKEQGEYWLEDLYKFNKTIYAVVITIITKKVPNRKNMLIEYFDRIHKNKIRATKNKIIRYFHEEDDFDTYDGIYFNRRWDYYGEVEERFIRRYLKR